MSDIIDINVNKTVEEVTINVVDNLITVNINNVTGGGGGSQTLAQTLDLGNTTGGENISISNGDAIILDNGSMLKKGTIDAGNGGSKGISQICGVGFEHKWEAGRLYIMNDGGTTIREVSHNFEVTPTGTDDVTKGFVENSRWILDNGDVYVCTDATTGEAVWEFVSGIPTLQEVTEQANETTIPIIVKGTENDKTITLSSGSLNFADIVNEGTTNLVFESSSIPNQQVLIKNETGTLALLSDIPTNTSDLTNDGADGVNPYITALDIPTTSQASTLVREVKNMTGATLTKGTVVYISGANGNKALVSKAIATTDALSARTFGLLQSDISNNGTGNCVIIGDLSGLDTSSFTEGDQLYLSGVTAGTYTSTRTLAPTHLVYIGKITRSHPTLGQIEVGIQNGYELAEIHDVALSSEANNQALIYESSTDLWKNKTIIEDSITNGVTTIAPSQNAVFDALALKQAALSYTPYKFIQTGITAHTGTVAETIIATATIAGGSFNASDVMKVMFGANKSSTATACTQRIKINTSNTLTGAVTLAGLNSTTANAIILKRNFVLNNGNLYGMQFSLTNTVTDEAVVLTSTYNNTPFNTANTLYLFFTVQLGNVADSVIPNLFNITN